MTILLALADLPPYTYSFIGNDTGVILDEAADDEAPEFLAPPMNITVGVGREAVLECPIRNIGGYRVAWVRSGDQTILTLQNKVVTHSSRFSIIHDTNSYSWQLHIRSVIESDKGCYMCQVNYKVMKKQLACIDLLEPPKILDDETSDDITVEEGVDVTLQCRGQGNPMPNIIWKREDARTLTSRRQTDGNAAPNNHSYSGERLVLQRITRHQAGAVVCIASNDVPPAVSKRIQINVTFKPSVTVPLLSYGSVLGGDVTMQCHIEANPAATNFWKHRLGSKQERVLTNGPKYTISETRTGYLVVLTAVIRNLSRSDLGEYKCFANSGVGVAESGDVVIHETDRVTLPPATRMVIRTTTSSSTTTTPLYTSTSVKATTQRLSQYPTTRVPLLVEIISNQELGDSIPGDSKARKTKSSSYQSEGTHRNIGTVSAHITSLYTVFSVLLGRLYVLM